jgi:hypothetical protein
MRKIAALLAVVAAAALASDPASARGRHHHGHGHARIGIGIGFGFGGYYPYYPPYYYSPYYYAQPPVTYIERSTSPAPQAAPQAEPAAPAGPDYWFFCRESNAYYPYVGQCTSGWERVPARPQD